jgi:hypothetical protein
MARASVRFHLPLQLLDRVAVLGRHVVDLAFGRPAADRSSPNDTLLRDPCPCLKSSACSAMSASIASSTASEARSQAGRIATLVNSIRASMTLDIGTWPRPTLSRTARVMPSVGFDHGGLSPVLVEAVCPLEMMG